MIEQTVSFWWFAGATFLPVIALGIAEIIIYIKEKSYYENLGISDYKSEKKEIVKITIKILHTYGFKLN